MRTNPFTRPTIIAAVEIFERLTQAQFNQLVVRLGLDDTIPSETVISVGKKCALVGREVAQGSNQVIQTLDGDVTLGEAVVREAVNLTSPHHQYLKQTALIRGLARDGYEVSWNSDIRNTPILRAALPNEIDLPATDDEVHQLLEHFRFQNSLGHLSQAIEAHTRGNWAAANGQTRSFLESLFNEIADYSYPQEAAQLSSSENRRALLAKKDFLSVARNEWTQDGKNYINGLFKMLHTEGSHPGLSYATRYLTINSVGRDGGVVS